MELARDPEPRWMIETRALELLNMERRQQELKRKERSDSPPTVSSTESLAGLASDPSTTRCSSADDLSALILSDSSTSDSSRSVCKRSHAEPRLGHLEHTLTSTRSSVYTTVQHRALLAAGSESATDVTADASSMLWSSDDPDLDLQSSMPSTALHDLVLEPGELLDASDSKALGSGCSFTASMAEASLERCLGLRGPGGYDALPIDDAAAERHVLDQLMGTAAKELRRGEGGDSLPPHAADDVMLEERSTEQGRREQAMMSSVAARLAAACQSTLLGRTLQRFGGIVQVITESAPPHRILSVSRGWERLCGYSREEVTGSTLHILQGDKTEGEAISALMSAMSAHVPVTVRLTNYTKRGEVFVHQLSAEPLCDPSGVTKCFQATSLVLQPPGERERNPQIDELVGRIPLVCRSPLPPLWTLLGRTIRPEESACKLVPPKSSNKRQAFSSASRRAPRSESAGDRPRSPEFARDHHQHQRRYPSLEHDPLEPSVAEAGITATQVEELDDNFLAWLQVEGARTMPTDELAAVLEENGSY